MSEQIEFEDLWDTEWYWDTTGNSIFDGNFNVKYKIQNKTKNEECYVGGLGEWNIDTLIREKNWKKTDKIIAEGWDYPYLNDHMEFVEEDEGYSEICIECENENQETQVLDSRGNIIPQCNRCTADWLTKCVCIGNNELCERCEFIQRGINELEDVEITIYE